LIANYNASNPPKSLPLNYKPRHVALMSNSIFGRSVLISRVQQSAVKSPLSPTTHFPQLMAFVQNPGWILKYLKDLFHSNVPYREYPPENSGIFRIPTLDSQSLRIAVAADWGTGTMEADAVKENMESGSPHYTVHLGDVYFMGEIAQVEENCLGKSTYLYRGVQWPTRGTLGSFALMGNHEMYSGGFGYFEKFLPVLGVFQPQRQP
jgi:hypothetical protein